MPKKAPTSIIPSSPMFTTPERSEMTPPRAAKIEGVANRSMAAARADQTMTRSRFVSPDSVAATAPIAQRTAQTIAPQPSRRCPSRITQTPRPAAPSARASDGTGVRTSSGGSASQNANRPSATAAQPTNTGRSTRETPSRPASDAVLMRPPPSLRRAAFAAAAACTDR